MTVRSIARTAFIAMTCLFLSAATQVLAADDVIAQYQGTAPGSAGGHSVTMVGLKVGSKAVMVAIPNDEPKKGETPKPKKELDDSVKKLTKGQYVKAGIGTSTLGPTLTSIEPYDTKPGEESPNGYVFSKTFEKSSGKLTTTTVVLTKFGKEYPFVIPTKKDEKGAQEQDPDIAAAVGKLQEGNSVWVQAAGSKLINIEPYTEPQMGKLVKLGETEVDGHKVPSAEVETDGGKTITLLVPMKTVGKSVAIDTAVNAELHRVHPNTAVEFRTHEDGDKIWLREIGPAPKEKKPAEAAKPDAKKPAK